MNDQSQENPRGALCRLIMAQLRTGWALEPGFRTGRIVPHAYRRALEGLILMTVDPKYDDPECTGRVVGWTYSLKGAGHALVTCGDQVYPSPGGAMDGAEARIVTLLEWTMDNIAGGGTP